MQRPPAARRPLWGFSKGSNLRKPAEGDATIAADYPSGLMQLDQFLKFQGLVGTGGEAKLLIQQGLVQVNDEIEKRRSRQLQKGDKINLASEQFIYSGEPTN